MLKGLTDKGEIDASQGRLATGVLIFQDLCVVPIMLVLPFRDVFISLFFVAVGMVVQFDFIRQHPS